MGTKEPGTDRTGGTLIQNVDRVLKSLYLITGILVFGGIYVDLTNQGEVILPWFVVVRTPYSNSGLFVAGGIVLLLAIVVSSLKTRYERRQREPTGDETQEWVVNIGGN